MKVLVTGGSGMVGHAFRNMETEHELILVGSADYNLVNTLDVKTMFSDIQPDAVIHLAARVGGVKGNHDFVADFFYENTMINVNLLNGAKNAKVEKVVSLLSTCVYPDSVIYPLTEDQVHNGEPHYSNFGYAYAKRMLDVHSRAIRRQYGLKYTTAVPNNLYGPNDNYDLYNGHAVAAVIRKIHEAKVKNKTPVFWGSGNPLREFTYTKDIAKILLWMLDNYEDEKPLNVGNSVEHSIRELVEITSDLLGYKGDILWDSLMPEGQYKKPSSNAIFKNLQPGFNFTDLSKGLSENIQWYEENYPNVRGI